MIIEDPFCTEMYTDCFQAVTEIHQTSIEILVKAPGAFTRVVQTLKKSYELTEVSIVFRILHINLNYF